MPQTNALIDRLGWVQPINVGHCEHLAARNLRILALQLPVNNDCGNPKFNLAAACPPVAMNPPEGAFLLVWRPSRGLLNNMGGGTC